MILLIPEGTVIDFIMRYEGFTKVSQALQFLGSAYMVA